MNRCTARVWDTNGGDMTSCDREVIPGTERCEEHRAKGWINEAQDAYEALGQKEREAVDAATTRVVRACERRRDIMYARARRMEAVGNEREQAICDQRSIEANLLTVEVAIACGGAHGSFRNIEPVSGFTFDVALQLMRAGRAVSRTAWREIDGSLSLVLDGDQLTVRIGVGRINRPVLHSEDVLAGDWHEVPL